MLARLAAALCLLTGAAFGQGGAKPTDPQIAHIVPILPGSSTSRRPNRVLL
jgi:hypothetical protein